MAAVRPGQDAARFSIPKSCPVEGGDLAAAVNLLLDAPATTAPARPCKTIEIEPLAQQQLCNS